MSDGDLTVDGVLDDLVIWGTPDKVADELVQFQETVGKFGTLLRWKGLARSRARPALHGSPC